MGQGQGRPVSQPGGSHPDAAPPLGVQLRHRGGFDSAVVSHRDEDVFAQDDGCADHRRTGPKLHSGYTGRPAPLHADVVHRGPEDLAVGGHEDYVHTVGGGEGGGYPVAGLQFEQGLAIAGGADLVEGQPLSRPSGRRQHQVLVALSHHRVDELTPVGTESLGSTGAPGSASAVSQLGGQHLEGPALRRHRGDGSWGPGQEGGDQHVVASGSSPPSPVGG